MCEASGDERGNADCYGSGRGKISEVWGAVFGGSAEGKGVEICCREGFGGSRVTGTLALVFSQPGCSLQRILC